ncbi:MAG TPA: hypothetical protein VMC79_09420 [Rectinemataceae bacterium]|nr:hypothetical protein [Rectinemataceae bacterium]
MRGFTATGRCSVLVLGLLSLLLLAPAALSAKQLGSDFGFVVDMPAGFVPGEGDGKTKFSYTDPNDGMEFDIRVYEPGRFATVEALAADIKSRLASTGEVDSFSYEGRKAVLEELNFALNGVTEKGYAILIQGRPSPPTATAAPSATAPSSGPGSAPLQSEPSFALLAFSGADHFEAYADLLLSCLDSFSIDSAALRSPGPLSQYVLPWPPQRTQTKTVRLPGGSSAELPWSDEEGAQEVDTATREYKVLASYAESQDLWVDAWARFYRMVYRESAARLDRLSLEFSRLLPPNDPTEDARQVLAWVQGFVYQRDEKGIDFVTPLHAAFEQRGDCDSRAIVMAIILERLGIDCVLMLSREYSHAMLGVNVPGGGQRFPWKGTSYLVAETTAKVGLGMIAASQSDFSKWLGVQLELR